MMMKAGPRAPFVVVEAEDPFGLLVVALDAPTQARQRHERDDVGVRVEIRQPRLGGLRLALRPMEQQPMLGLQILRMNRASAVAPCNAARGSDAHGRKATALRTT